MSETPGHDYDRVAYPSLAHPQTFAEQLSIKGFLRGLDVARPDVCRVLELGCGDGFNLAAMAAIHPGASYTGIDYSAEAISRGRQMLDSLDWQKIRLETADIRALGEFSPPLGEFDYIIAHGVYSWVPADVRDALLATISRLLAPHGVAFVSYLVLPGAYQREAVRSIIRFHTRAEKDPLEQIKQARSVLRFVAKGALNDNLYTRGIAAELDLIEKHSDEGFFHDELSAVSAPVLFTEFLSHAANHGLQFLGEAEYILPVSPGLTDEARTILRPLEANRVALEQYMDFAEGRRFRQTLLCRPGLGGEVHHKRLDHLWVNFQGTTTAPAPGKIADTASIEFDGLRGSKLRASRLSEKAVLLTLADQQGAAISFPALLAAVRARVEREGLELEPEFEAEIRQYLCRGYVPGLIDFSWDQLPYTLQVPARPHAHPLALWLLDRGASSVLSFSGRFVEVNGVLGRHLLSQLDGTRDQAALVAAVRVFLGAQPAAVVAKGEKASLPASDDPTLGEQLQRSLTGLAALGLFRRE